ncbi:DUF943 family protein [Franconibacter pulveris]
MKKLLLILGIVAIMLGCYFYLNNRKVTVIDAHHGHYAAQVLVNHLPLSNSARIQWWITNQPEIFSKYKIAHHDAGGPSLITIFAFGKGYQEENNEDRLCFDDMDTPKNCIDKDSIMTVFYSRNGDIEFRFDNVVYIRNKEGRIYQSEEE